MEFLMVKMPWTGIFVDVFVSFYGEDVPIKELSKCVAHYSHLCTLYWWLRFSLHPQNQGPKTTNIVDEPKNGAISNDFACDRHKM